MMFIGLLAASSCNDKLVCSAYQSYFVLDNVNYPRNGYPKNRAEGLEANRFDYPDASYHQRENPIRDEYYAYLDSDSMPKVANAEKDQFGIIKKQRLRAKDRAMQNIPMEVVIPPAPDSLLYGGDDELLTELDLVDSAAVDSVRSLGRTYQYNVDQKYYLWYLRNKLVWKDELEKEDEIQEGSEEELAPGEEGAEEKEGFFKRTIDKIKNLFKKKEPAADPAVDEAPVEETEEEDPDGF